MFTRPGHVGSAKTLDSVNPKVEPANLSKKMWAKTRVDPVNFQHGTLWITNKSPLTINHYSIPVVYPNSIPYVKLPEGNDFRALNSTGSQESGAAVGAHQRHGPLQPQWYKVPASARAGVAEIGLLSLYGFVWKCWVYSQWNSHLVGIMIINHWV